MNKLLCLKIALFLCIVTVDIYTTITIFDTNIKLFSQKNGSILYFYYSLHEGLIYILIFLTFAINTSQMSCDFCNLLQLLRAAKYYMYPQFKDSSCLSSK